jgi:hypothetical protein
LIAPAAFALAGVDHFPGADAAPPGYPMHGGREFQWRRRVLNLGWTLPVRSLLAIELLAATCAV